MKGMNRRLQDQNCYVAFVAVAKSENIIMGQKAIKATAAFVHDCFFLFFLWGGGTVFEMLHFTDTNSKFEFSF